MEAIKSANHYDCVIRLQEKLGGLAEVVAANV
uniref:Uncharacterized protein n=1 Tax=viral metagenome TaxID=1070528 RepID=A0A6C0I9L7_9ZZZZ